MTLLTLIFFGMALYGAIVGQYGVALIALGMAGFMIYASKVFAQQDKAWASDPKQAPAERATQEILDEAGVECSTPCDRS